MHGRLLAASLLVVGIALMANPLYLPVTVGESTPVYTHAVQPVGPDSPPVDASDVVPATDLDPDAREAFERALDAEEAGFVVEDPDERAESLSYPTEPSLGDGLLVVSHDGDRYEFWTRTVERDSDAVVAQRVVVQPAAFLVGFLAVIAAVAVAMRDSPSGSR